MVRSRVNGCGGAVRSIFLTGQDIELGSSLAKPFELRQMRMQIECIDALQQAEPVERRLDLDWRGRSIRFGCRVKSEAILHRHTKAGEERAREAAELLLWRDSLIPVVEEVRHLALQALVMGKIRHIADVMVWADENEIVRLREKLPDSLDLGLVAIWPVRNESKLMMMSVSARSRIPASSAVTLPSSATRSISTTGWPVSASACSMKAVKLRFMMWSRKPPML